jgi:hypothetical protein
MSNDVYNQIGQASALGSLATAKAVGQKGKFYHEDLPGIIISFNIISIGVADGNTPGIAKHGRVLKLHIPYQTGVGKTLGPDHPLTEGDKIEYPLDSGDYIFIVGPFNSLGNGYVHECMATDTKSFTYGPGAQ